MVQLTAEQYRAILDYPQNIRNVTIVAGVDHGKSVVLDSLMSAGIRFSQQPSFEERLKCIRPSLINSLYFERKPKVDDPSTIVYDPPDNFYDQLSSPVTDKSYLVNILSSPRNIDCNSSDILPTSRLVDGVIIVVDCIEGVNISLQSILRETTRERLKPILVLNKLDRALLELQLTGEEIYQSINQIIDNLNTIITSFPFHETSEPWKLDPIRGNVLFASGLHQWGFTIQKFASFYAQKFNVTVDNLTEKLWGDWAFVSGDSNTKWIQSTTLSSNNGRDQVTGAERSFISFIVKPIVALFVAVMNNQVNKQGIPKAFKMAAAIGVNLSEEIRQNYTGKPLLKYIMRNWLPFNQAANELIVVHLPSPVTAQLYRTEILYEGPLDDEVALAMRCCDPSESVPLLIYVAKMIPDYHSRFVALGRVFSGKVHEGQKVRILGPNYLPGKRNDLFIHTVKGLEMIIGRDAVPTDDIPAGNLCRMIGIDQFLLKNGTITTSDIAYRIRNMNYSVSPIISGVVMVQRPEDLPTLISGLKYLSRYEDNVRCEINEVGEPILSASNEMILSQYINELTHISMLKDIPLHPFSPVIQYCETITCPSPEVLAKSPNKHNRLYCRTNPLTEDIQHLFDTGAIGAHLSTSEQAAILQEHQPTRGRPGTCIEPHRIWCFGDDNIGPNILMEQTKGLQFLFEVKPGIVEGFKWACREGPLCEERVRGVQMHVTDVVFYADAIHRGFGQILPPARRVTYGGILSSNPTLLEPIYLVEIFYPNQYTSSIQEVLSIRSGTIFDIQEGFRQQARMKAYLPASESFGIYQAISSASNTGANVNMTFDHWQIISGGGDVRDSTSRLGTLINSIRERKHLALDIPPIEKFLDTF